MNILVIDDNEIQSKNIQNNFKEDDLDLAKNINNAKYSLDNKKYDIIFFNNDIIDQNYTYEDLLSVFKEKKVASSSDVIVYSKKNRNLKIAKRYLPEKCTFLKSSYLDSFIQNNPSLIKESNIIENSNKESQSIWDILFDKMQKIKLEEHPQEEAVENLYKIWSDQNNKIGSNQYKKPIHISSDKMRDMEREGLVHFNNDKFSITKKGKNMLKTMILGDERSIFDEKKNNITFKKAKNNADYPKRKAAQKKNNGNFN